MTPAFLRSTDKVASASQSALITMLTNLLLGGVGIATGSLAARLLGPYGRGQLAAIRSWPMLFATIGTLGLPEAMVFFAAKRRKEGLGIVWISWALLIPLSIFWMALGYVLVPTLLSAQEPEVVSMARIFLLIIPFHFLYAARFVFQGRNDFTSWNILRTLPSLLYLVVLVRLSMAELASAFAVAQYELLTYIPILLLTVARLNRHGSLLAKPPDWAIAKPMLVFGLQSILGTTAETINGRLDQLIMAAFLAPEHLGLYAIGVSWSMVLSPVVSAIASVTFPKVAGLNGKDETGRWFMQICRITILLVSVLGLVTLIVTPVGIRVLFGREFVHAISCAMVLVVASTIWHLNLVLRNGLRGLGLPLASAWANGAGTGAGALLLWLLLPRFHIMGAALASLLAYTVTLIVLSWQACQHLGQPARHLLLPESQDLAMLCQVTRRFVIKISPRGGGR